MRELKNVIERAVILSTGPVLQLDLTGSGGRSLPSPARPADGAAPAGEVPPPGEPAGGGAGRPYLTEAELKAQQRANLIAALEAAGWRVSGKGGAAALLGIRPTTLADRIKTLGITRPA